MDIPRTLEYLETKGVPVIGYKTDQLPAFFTRESGLKLAIRKDSLNEIAQLINAKDALELSGGTVIANPISEDDQLDKDYIDSIINEAIESANEEGISGKEMTPFLLSKIVDKTNGKSLEANISLVFNNADIGSKLAVELSKLF